MDTVVSVWGGMVLVDGAVTASLTPAEAKTLGERLLGAAVEAMAAEQAQDRPLGNPLGLSSIFEDPA